MSNIWHDISPARIQPEDFVAVIEIPKGSKKKYELDKETGEVRILDYAAVVDCATGIHPNPARVQDGGGLVQGMGMDLMAANFFVFYFGIVADITPPVALAAYAGSAIAKAPPMRTAFNATRLAIAAFIVPYIFAFNNTMLFIGDFGPLDVVQVVLTSSVGMFLIAAGMIGYMLRDLNWGVRIVCIAAGLMLIHPGTLTDIIGIGVLVVVLVFQIITGKGSKAVKAA